jgi:uncharacterized repeat protein (TIGR01451 family)
MATFKNQATLTYNGITTSSNVVTGEIVGVLSASKNALEANYGAGDVLSYIISLINSGDAALTDVTVTDDLGKYTSGGASYVPLTYVPGSAVSFVDGVMKPVTAAVTADGLVFSNVTVPANGNTLIIYEAEANEYAPLAAGGSITNSLTAASASVGSPVTASRSLPVRSEPELSISKALAPLSVNENGSLTYTFTIENTGSEPAGEDAQLIITDEFDPVLSNLTVTLNGAPLVLGTDYTYNPATGVFSTAAGAVTVPAAEISQGPDGVWSAVPGTAVLCISGSI